jgi:hypothetical protein
VKIVPSANLGDLGPKEVEASVFNWKWYYTLPGYTIWLVLLAAIVLPKQNRHINVLAILVPIAVLNLLWPILVKVTSMPSSAENQYSVVFQSMLIGIAVLWLMTDYIVRFGGFTRFLLSLVIIIVTASVGILSYSASFSREIPVFLVLFVCMAFALLIAITISRWLCRKKFSPVRFMLWLALWTILLGSFATLIFFIIGNLILSSSPSRLIQQLIQVLLIGLIFGLFIYVINLPYMLLGFVNPFFRKRFYDCLRLKPAPATVDSNSDSSDRSDMV